ELNTLQMFLIRRSDGNYWNGSSYVAQPTALALDGPDAAGIWQVSADLPEGTALRDGRYLINATATDRAGNIATVHGGFDVRASATIYVVTNTRDSGRGSLRAALTYANHHAGTLIKFSIRPNDPNRQVVSPQRSVWRIRPHSALPAITASSTRIDGA